MDGRVPRLRFGHLGRHANVCTIARAWYGVLSSRFRLVIPLVFRLSVVFMIGIFHWSARLRLDDGHGGVDCMFSGLTQKRRPATRAIPNASSRHWAVHSHFLPFRQNLDFLFSHNSCFSSLLFLSTLCRGLAWTTSTRGDTCIIGLGGRGSSPVLFYGIDWRHIRRPDDSFLCPYATTPSLVASQHKSKDGNTGKMRISLWDHCARHVLPSRMGRRLETGGSGVDSLSPFWARLLRILLGLG